MELSTTLFWRHNFRPAISYLALAMLLILIFFRNRKIAFAITALSFLVVNVGLTVQIGEDSGVYTYGVAFFDHVENFWEMEFPPPTPKEQELGVLTMVCYMCQTFERVDDHSIEADVVATNDGVLRYCKRCGNSTIWKVGQPGAVPAAAANASAPPPTSPHLSMPAPMTPPQRVASPPAFASVFNPADPPPFPVAAQPENAGASAYSEATPSDLVVGLPAPATRTSITSPFRAPQPHTSAGSLQSPSASVLTLPEATEKTAGTQRSPVGKPSQKSGPKGVNRRKYPRIKVDYIALVRHAERGEEFVQCKDVSRGGLRFKSTSRYMEQTLIEVAAPYSSGQAAIFVAARIVFAQELPEQNLFRYGVQYLHTDRPRGAF